MPAPVKFFKVQEMPPGPEGSAIYFVATSSGRMQTVVTSPDGSEQRVQGGYVHEQVDPSATWTIDHNLGARPAAVSVFDTNDDEWEGDISHPTLNRTVITFSAAFAGTATLI